MIINYTCQPIIQCSYSRHRCVINNLFKSNCNLFQLQIKKIPSTLRTSRSLLPVMWSMERHSTKYKTREEKPICEACIKSFTHDMVVTIDLDTSYDLIIELSHYNIRTHRCKFSGELGFDFAAHFMGKIISVSCLIMTSKFHHVRPCCSCAYTGTKYHRGKPFEWIFYYMA